MSEILATIPRWLLAIAFAIFVALLAYSWYIGEPFLIHGQPWGFDRHPVKPIEQPLSFKSAENHETDEVSPFKTWLPVVAADLDLPEGEWTIFLTGVAVHTNASFRLSIDGTSENMKWG